MIWVFKQISCQKYEIGNVTNVLFANENSLGSFLIRQISTLSRKKGKSKNRTVSFNIASLCNRGYIGDRTPILILRSLK